MLLAVIALLAAGSARVLEDTIITASDGAPSDQFGNAVGVSGSTLVVGAQSDDSDAGSAYVFSRDGSSWTQEAKLVAPDGQANENYGFSVAVDGSTIVVGAPFEDGHGAAHVHTTSDGGETWSAGVKIVSTSTATNDKFGSAVAVDGSVVAVGAQEDDDNGSNSGSVFIFVSSDGGASWPQTDALTGSDAGSSAQFGRVIDIDGSIMVIGAIGVASFTGAAYVFVSSDGGSTWTETGKLVANDGALSDFFGSSVAVAGDFIAVGAPYDDDGATSAGSVYTFTTSDGGTSWSQTAKLVSDAPSAEGLFGNSVAASGNLLVVGAPFADDFYGIAFVFETDDGGATWTLAEKLSASDRDNEELFPGFIVGGTQLGTSVATDGSLVFAGGVENGGGNGHGAVYFLNLAPATESATHSASATASATASADAGTVGDPILVDFAGHRFMGGSRGRTEYLLYRSHDETEAITMTTGNVQGTEGGFFAVAVGVQRAGCGSLRIAAGLEHTSEISGDACMTAQIARGDEGLVLVPIGEGGDTGSVLAVYPHHHGDSAAFLNTRLLATTPAFRAGCTGMLCNEAHADIEA